MIRTWTLAAVVAGVMVAGPAEAQLMRWYALDDVRQDNGLQQAEVIFGIPRSDEMLMSASCTSAEPRQIDVQLFIDPGPNQPDVEADLTFASGADALVRRGTWDTGWAGGSFVRAQLDRDDPVWEMLAAGDTATVVLEGGQPADVPLRGSAAAIAQFMQSCASFAG